MDTSIQKYQAFLKTVETGSFTRAAALLSYSQSGVSRMIRDLEREWNVSLLERNRGGVRPTSDGMKLLPHARRLCEEYRKLQMEVDALSGLQSGMIRIGTISSVATHWLPRVIRRFQRDYPNIGYELLLGDYTEIETWIGEGRVDCGFLLLPTRPEFETVFLERDQLMAVIPQGHPMASLEKFPAAALEREPFLLLDKGERSEVVRFLQAHHLTPDVHFTTWDDYAIMSMVESGLGVAILPRLILRRAPYQILEKELDVEAYRDIGLALRQRETAPRAVKRFLEYLPYR